MAQHDYVIANGTGAAVRSDLNNALAAIVSQNSGATAPATTYAYQFWADTTTNLLKLRNSANSAWITLFQLDGEWSTLPVENGTAAAPSIYFKDSGIDSGFFSPGTDQVGITTAGTARLTIDANGNVAVDTNTLYVDAPNNRVGIGTSSPQKKTHFAISSGTGLLSNYDGLLLENQTSAIGSTVGIGFGFGGLANGATAGITAIQAETTQTATHLAFFTRHDASGGLTAEKMRINSSGNVGIGTASPAELLDVYGTGNTTVRISGSSGGGGDVSQIDFFRIGSNVTSSIKAVRDGGNTSGALTFLTASSGTNSERARLTASGQWLVGTSTSIGNNDIILAATGNGNNLGAAAFRASASGAEINLYKSRSATVGTNTVVQSGDTIAQFDFKGADGTNYITAASVIAQVDGTPGTNDMPGRLVFSTTADGASSPTERMRIDSTGAVLIGKTTSALNTAGMFISSAGEFNIGRNGDVASFNRIATDGTIVRFFQDATEEGTISVSGTTVSYNGAHLSRWSQLPSGAERTEILRGSVLSNIDEMCEWGDEENEQLNRMKISDVEGDKNVSGVFQAWDDDDDTYINDFYCAMTGDFIIRIGAGVTVERGDLLMSAGDGTAKPQDDDIIRSKTIAKVTSTNVSCTYEDGSYCVPCVLMAC